MRQLLIDLSAASRSGPPRKQILLLGLLHLFFHGLTGPREIGGDLRDDTEPTRAGKVPPIQKSASHACFRAAETKQQTLHPGRLLFAVFYELSQKGLPLCRTSTYAVIIDCST